MDIKEEKSFPYTKCDLHRPSPSWEYRNTALQSEVIFLFGLSPLFQALPKGLPTGTFFLKHEKQVHHKAL